MAGFLGTPLLSTCKKNNSKKYDGQRFFPICVFYYLLLSKTLVEKQHLLTHMLTFEITLTTVSSQYFKQKLLNGKTKQKTSGRQWNRLYVPNLCLKSTILHKNIAGDQRLIIQRTMILSRWLA